MYQNDFNGGADNDFYREQRFIGEKTEKAEIRKVGTVAGLCVIASVGIQNLISLFFDIPALRQMYFAMPAFQNFITALSSILSVGLPFMLGALYLHKHTDADIFKFNVPEKKALAIFAVPFGFFVCLAANYITTIMVSVFENAGISLFAPDYTVPSGIAGRAVYIFAVAVVPPVVEELAMRGMVMQPLRKYGDAFAIVISAAVFAILHGNLIQAPFAFMAGLALGYAVCVTESLWTGIAIHFVNNAYSAFAEFLMNDITDEEKLNHIWFIVILCLFAVSIIGSVIFFIVKGKKQLNNTPTFLSGSQKAFAFFANIAMIIAVLIMLKVTAGYVRLN